MSEAIVKATRVMALVRKLYKHANNKELITEAVVHIYNTNPHDAKLFVEQLLEKK